MLLGWRFCLAGTLGISMLFPFLRQAPPLCTQPAHTLYSKDTESRRRFPDYAQKTSNGVADQVGPFESRAEKECPGMGVANSVKPPSLIELAELNTKREDNRKQGYRTSVSADKAKAQKQKQRQRPQCVAGIRGDNHGDVTRQ